jgi:hypothetical protein
MDIGSVDIARESTNMAMADVHMKAGISIMKMEMDAQSEIAMSLVSQLMEVMPPIQGLGAIIDTAV